jgi:tetratricopeptide (TPR) repeat protein
VNGEDEQGREIPDPPVDEDVTAEDLDKDLRDELSGLSAGAAKAVARHLVMAARLLDEDPESAYQHALAARRRAGRIGLVGEAAGVAAYRAEHYAEALSELRAARRMTGSAEYLPMMADCERGLGRPERALDLASDPAVTGLDTPGRMEMLIVAAGARRDMGQHAAAAAMLQVPELRAELQAGWVARLQYAYADALEAAGRVKESRRWFLRAADADIDEETDAAERAVRDA